MKVNASMDVKPIFLDFNFGRFRKQHFILELWPKTCITDTFLFAILCIWRTVQAIRCARGGTLSFSTNSSDASRKMNISTMRQASLSLGAAVTTLLQKREHLRCMTSLDNLGQSCFVHVNGLRLAACHSPDNGTVLKLTTVQYASQSCSLRRKQRCKEKANLLYHSRSCGKVYLDTVAFVKRFCYIG